MSHILQPSLFFAAVFALPSAYAQDSAKNAESPGEGALSTTIKLAPKIDSDGKWLDDLSITPRILQSNDGTTGSLGVGYSFSVKPVSMIEKVDEIGGPVTGNIRMYSIELTANGLYAARPEVNTGNVIDASSSGTYLILQNGVYAKTAFSAAYSRQQGNDTHASRWEISQGLGTWLPRLNNVELLGRLALARVNPINDVAREAALGGALKSYQRLEFEGVAVIPINAGALQKVELRHLLFKELSAPEKVRAAALDSFKTSSIYFRLSNGLFVAYSKGGVPADRKNSQVLQIGWSSNSL